MSSSASKCACSACSCSVTRSGVPMMLRAFLARDTACSRAPSAARRRARSTESACSARRPSARGAGRPRVPAPRLLRRVGADREHRDGAIRRALSVPGAKRSRYGSRNAMPVCALMKCANAKRCRAAPRAAPPKSIEPSIQSSGRVATRLQQDAVRGMVVGKRAVKRPKEIGVLWGKSSPRFARSRSRSPGPTHVAARRTSDALIDAGRVERLEHQELIGHLERA